MRGIEGVMRFVLFDRLQECGLEKIAAKNPSSLEGSLKKHDIFRYAGVDEAGRGPLAGPVVACACVLPVGSCFEGLADSKALSEKAIGVMYHTLIAYPGVEYSVGVVDHDEIDRVNILQATFQAMRHAVEGLSMPPELVLIDGNQVPPMMSVSCLSVVKGDRHCRSVSAASVIAKFTRDQLMRDFDKQWPHYGFARHKGYGTAFHVEQLKKYGPCPIHRITFSPVSKSLV